jgi:hypothetical protein
MGIAVENAIIAMQRPKRRTNVPGAKQMFHALNFCFRL